MIQPTKGPHHAGTQGTKIQDFVFAHDRLTLLGMAWSDTDPRDIEGSSKLFVSKDEAAANARLWATAWEMLEVLKAQIAFEQLNDELLEVARTEGRTFLKAEDQVKLLNESRRIWEARRDAIAKATGNAQ